MPEFGYGIGDLLIFVSPFAVLYALKRIRAIDFSIGAGGAVLVGLLCLLARRVNLRYGMYYEGATAVGVGLLYIAGGAVYLIWERRNRRTEQTDAARTRTDGEDNE